jgi:hypothetical protein
MAETGAADPGAQPAAEEAAARHGREVVELVEQIVPGQPLHHSQREGGAPDAAAREAKRRQLLFMDLLVNARQTDVVDLLEPGEGVFQNQPVALDRRAIRRDPIHRLGAELDPFEVLRILGIVERVVCE